MALPQVLALAVVGAGVFLGYRWLAHRSGRLAQDVKKARDAFTRRTQERPLEKDLGTLERDPETGEFKPRDRNSSG
ncbi:MAG: hypothetical protein AAFR04_14655 [Pseudomonadota bacterium]